MPPAIRNCINRRIRLRGFDAWPNGAVEVNVPLRTTVDLLKTQPQEAVGAKMAAFGTPLPDPNR
jgi:hypothetical protein